MRPVDRGMWGNGEKIKLVEGRPGRWMVVEEETQETGERNGGIWRTGGEGGGRK